MLLSQTSRYALGAAVYLAEQHAEDRSVAVGGIADAIGGPRTISRRRSINPAARAC